MAAKETKTEYVTLNLMPRSFMEARWSQGAQITSQLRDPEWSQGFEAVDGSDSPESVQSSASRSGCGPRDRTRSEVGRRLNAFSPPAREP